MKAQFRWHDDEQTIIVADIEGGWHFEDLFVIVDKVEELIATVDGVVDVVLDYADAGMPIGNLVHVVQELVKEKRPQLGLVVLVGMGTFINVMLEAALKVFPRDLSNFRVASDLDGALKLIQRAKQERGN